MLQDFVSSKRGSFAPGVHTELRAQRSTNRRVVLYSGNLVQNVRSESSGVCARVWKNGVCGLSSMADLSDEAVSGVLKAATDNAVFLDAHAGRNVPMFPAIPFGQAPDPTERPDTPQTVYLDVVRQLDDYISKKYPNLASRAVIGMADSMEKVLSASDGWLSHSVAPRSYVMILMDAMTDAGAPVELYEAFGGAGQFGDLFQDPAALYGQIDDLYERVMKKREGVFADAGLKTVILGGKMSGMLAHEAVGHTVEADLVLGGSVAGPNLNKRVGSDLVNLVDFAHHAFGDVAPLPVWVDDEGTPARDVTLIENGILKAFMNNRQFAQQLGMEPTGNARAYAFSDEPLVRMRNTALHPGTDKLADMIASVDDGYYLIATNNGQADLTGEFMFGVTEGYEIKNGKLGKALLDTTVSGVAFEMLKTVDMVSDNLTWVSSGMCGKKQPMPVSMGGPELRCKIMIGGR